MRKRINPLLKQSQPESRPERPPIPKAELEEIFRRAQLEAYRFVRLL